MNSISVMANGRYDVEVEYKKGILLAVVVGWPLDN